MHGPAYLAYSFLALTIFLIIMLIVGVEYGRRKAGLSPRITIVVSLITFAWMALSGVLTAQGIFQDFDAMPPRFPLLVVPPMIGCILAVRSKSLGKVMAQIPSAWPIGLQIFRIPMELILWGLFVEAVIPVQMTFEGANFDIMSAILAIPAAFLVVKGKASPLLIRIYNYVGLLLLGTIVTIAILSTPTPLRVFMNEPANTFITYLPYCWLPGIVVMMAFFLHLISLKQLKLKQA